MLDRILAEVKKDIEKRKRKGEDLSTRLTKIKSLAGAIEDCKTNAVIAEIKQKSPSEGTLKKNPDVVELSREYESGGAVAISVLTEKNFFGGALENLIAIRQEVNLPLLRKDFIIDEFQIQESFAYEADAVLLIVSVLGKKTADFVTATDEVGLECVVECRTQGEIAVALDAGADIIGINNRNLKTLNVDINATKELAKYVPDDKVLISESGIKNANDVRFLLDSGADAVLVGTTLMRSPNPKETLLRLTRC